MNKIDLKQAMEVLDEALEELCKGMGFPAPEIKLSKRFKPQTAEELAWVIAYLALQNIFIAGCTIQERDKKSFELPYAENGFSAKFLIKMSEALFRSPLPDFVEKFQSENWPPNPVSFVMKFDDQEK